MIFEDALSELRKGKKIRHPHFENDEYLMGCYTTLLHPSLFKDAPGYDESKFTKESFEEMKSRRMNITWMKGEFLHPKMKPKFPPECESDLHSFPQLNLLYIMSEEWETF